ncbi:hypothetical protein Kpho02_35450 [Kitasatospora phosalacinea]|uniref:Uncharacterized protein n=1 Tax=Kitasatospora phosalacinea TaxID=2065 RepID=A0A9W6Q9I1_9ACTN|nr:hypothetical protein [Kitasatospora phosalacinea]GLW71246.1 hypothetical protein Kpho02_35450 [Kitasatospora phosalacinea]
MRRATTADRASLLLPLLTAVPAWAAWLGWDGEKDVAPDGTVSGPYQVWQVLGLVVTVGAAVCWSAYRGRTLAAVAGSTVGLAGAAWVDWSRDGDGLFAVGVALVAVGALVVSGLLAAATTALTRRG